MFSLLHAGTQAGQDLVAHPRIKAVGFTGSRAGGMALMAVAAAREEPIPVYAEMSSLNPVVLLPAALAARAEDIARAFAASLTLGSGSPREFASTTAYRRPRSRNGTSPSQRRFSENSSWIISLAVETTCDEAW